MSIPGRIMTQHDKKQRVRICCFSEWWLPGAGGGEEMGNCFFNGNKVSVLQDEQICGDE